MKKKHLDWVEQQQQQQQQQQQHGIVSLQVPSSNNDDGARWRMHTPRTGSRSLYTVQVGSCGTCGEQEGNAAGGLAARVRRSGSSGSCNFHLESTHV